MNADEALRGLQEIPLPPPVSWLPQTGGWLVVLGALLLVLTVGLWRAWRRYQADRYRREAEAELNALQRRMTEPDHYANALATLPALVKRTALGFAPREQVASLSGESWLRFLDDTMPPAGASKKRKRRKTARDAEAKPHGTLFQQGPGRLLWQCAYRDAEFLRSVPRADSDALCALLRRWIEQHVPV